MSRPDAGLAMTPTETTARGPYLAARLRPRCPRPYAAGGSNARRTTPSSRSSAGTDVRAHARSLRRVWEAALEGGRSALKPRSVIEQSWARMQLAGLDPERLRPDRALDADALEQARTRHADRRRDGRAAPLPGRAGRRCPARDGRQRRRRPDPLARGPPARQGRRGRADRVQRKGCCGARTARARTRSAPRWRSTTRCRSSAAEHFLADAARVVVLGGADPRPGDGRAAGRGRHQRAAADRAPALASAWSAPRRGWPRTRCASGARRTRTACAQAYLERTARLGRHRSAMVGRDGRVLVANPAGWVSGAVELPEGGGAVTLPDGRQALAEPLEDGGHLLWGVTGRARIAPARPALRLDLLGRQGADRPHRQRPHAPAGRAPGRDPRAARAAPGRADRRAAHVRALRRARQPGVDARPDLQAAPAARPGPRLPALPAAGRRQRRLPRGRAPRPGRRRRRCAARLPAPLLVESEVPRIVQAREELEGALRARRAARRPGHAVALAGDREWARRRRRPARLPARSAARRSARPVALARLRAVQRRWADAS